MKIIRPIVLKSIRTRSLALTLDYPSIRIIAKALILTLFDAFLTCILSLNLGLQKRIFQLKKISWLLPETKDNTLSKMSPTWCQMKVQIHQ